MAKNVTEQTPSPSSERLNQRVSVDIRRLPSNTVSMPQQTSPLARALAAEIRSRIERRKLSQTAFGQLVGWPQRLVSRRVTGEVAMNAAELEAVAAVLNVSSAHLLKAAQERIKTEGQDAA